MFRMLQNKAFCHEMFIINFPKKNGNFMFLLIQSVNHVEEYGFGYQTN